MSESDRKDDDFNLLGVSSSSPDVRLPLSEDSGRSGTKAEASDFSRGLESGEGRSLSLDTGALLVRANRGEPGAFDELIRHVSGRLLAIAHRMTANYPQVRRWEETDDILQESLIRMQRALTEVQPDSLAGFFGLAATLLRRTLIDFSRHYYGACGLGARHQSGIDWQRDFAGLSAEGASRSTPLKSLEDWSAFHEAIGRLPEKEREVFGLLWYTGLTQRQVASLLEVSVRTIIRRLNRARFELYRLLADSSTNGD